MVTPWSHLSAAPRPATQDLLGTGSLAMPQTRPPGWTSGTSSLSHRAPPNGASSDATWAHTWMQPHISVGALLSSVVAVHRLRSAQTVRGRAQDSASVVLQGRNCFAGGGRPSLARNARLRLVATQVFDRFREDAITAIYCAQEEAIRQGIGLVRTELILYGVLSEEQTSGGNRAAKSALTQNGVTIASVKEVIKEFASVRGSQPSTGSGSLPFSDNAKLLFDLANTEAKSDEVGSEQLLLAILKPELAECGAAKMIAKLGVNNERLLADLQAELGQGSGQVKQLATAGAAAGDDKKLTLESVATNLTQMALDKLLDPVIGRDEELQRCIQILLRRRKNNACLVGPPGVGKTAIAEGLAQLIVAGQVPPRLRGKVIYSLDLGSVVAGTKYRGEFEERLKSIIDEVKQDEKICLFIDEIHQLVGAGLAGGESSMDAANLLKPALARGELQVIGATTVDEYVKHIEKDAALERRFQKVPCEEQTVDQTIQVLEGIRSSYEAHHGVLVAPEALTAAARWSDRYIADRFLPDKAIDLIDEAGSVVQLRNSAVGSGDDALEVRVEDKPVVTVDDIAELIAKWSGVPVERLTEDGADQLMKLEETMAQRVVGQSAAVSALARAVRRSRAGLAGRGRPVASFYFAGPTGVGKTELCKVLASQYYLDEKAMIRLDMSEYSESHSVSRLVGPPPGYVGYDDPRSGQLTTAVRQRPYSVVVLDEIEKAHAEVMNMLLQLLEDGRLTDGKGRSVSFANCIIIMTSNLGSRQILEQVRQNGSYDQMRSAVQAELQRAFKPEFVNRIDELIVFQALSTPDLRQITALLLADAAHRAVDARQEVLLTQSSSDSTSDLSADLEITWTSALEDLIMGHGSGMTYGARPLRRAVQRYFEDPVAELLVSSALDGKAGASVDIENDSIVVRCGSETLRPRLTVSVNDILSTGSASSSSTPKDVPAVGPAAVAVS